MGTRGPCGVIKVFYDSIVVVVTQLCVFVKIHQTVYLKGVNFPEHKSCSPEASISNMQKLLFLPPVSSCLISHQALPWGCLGLPLTCALHRSHISQLRASSWTLSSLLMAWITPISPSGSQLNLFPNKKIKKSWDSTRCWQGCRTTGLPCWWEWKLMQLLWKSTWQYLLKLNTRLPYDPAISHLLYIAKENAHVCAPKGMPSYVRSNIKCSSTNSKQPKCPFIRDRMDTEIVEWPYRAYTWQWKWINYIQQLTNNVEWNV